MPSLKDKGVALLGSATVDMKTAGSTTVFITPLGKVTRTMFVVVRDPTASLAGGVNYGFTNFRQAVDLSSMTTAATDYIVLDGNNVKYTEMAAATSAQVTVVSGSTTACSATIDWFGYTT